MKVGFGKMVGILALLALIATGAFLFAATTPVFLGLRQGVMQDVLSNLLKRPVTINGDVKLSFAGDVGVVIEDVRLEPLVDRASLLENQYIERMEFRVPPSLLIGAGSTVNRFQISGARIDMGHVMMPPKDPSAGAFSLSPAIRNFLTNPLSRDLRISDIVLRYRNDRNGWDEELAIDIIRSESSADGRFLEIEFDGSINRTPVKMSGRIQDPEHPDTTDNVHFSAVSETNGLVSELVGSLNIAQPDIAIKADSSSQSHSIGELLETLDIARVIDGDFTLSATFEGSLDAPRLSNLRGAATLENGDQIAVTGDIDDFGAGTGIAIHYSVDFAETQQSEGDLSALPPIDDNLHDSGTIPVPVSRPNDAVGGNSAALPPIEDQLRDTGTIPVPVSRPEILIADTPPVPLPIDDDLHDSGAIPLPVPRPAHALDAQRSAADQTLLNIGMTGYSGRIVGDQSAIGIEDAIVKTNAANLEIREIGPISIGRIVKDQANRIGLLGIRILDGPPGRPTLVLEGDVGDLLGFSDVRLAGSFDAPLDLGSNTEADSQTPKLGRVKGTISIADIDGTVGIEELSGRIEDGDLVELAFELAVGQIRRLDDIAFKTDIRIPDLNAFSVAIGESVESQESAHFAGDLVLSGPVFRATGEASLGQTDINADLQTKGVEGATLLSGKVTSPLVRLSDVGTAIELFSRPDTDVIDLEIDDIKHRFQADVLFDIGKIAGSRKATGKASGRFSYADSQVKLENLALGYLGGTISGDFTGDFRKATPSYYANGRITEWQMGRFLGELGLSAPISGTLYMSVDARAYGKAAKSLLNSLTGSVNVSLWSGTVPGRLLDLTGLNLVSWMFAKQSDNTKIVCALVPLRFKNGRASGNNIIIETDNVQIVGGGWINFPQDTFELSFLPRPKRQQAVNVVSPFTVHGSFTDPQLRLEEGKGARIVAEVVSLPFNLIGRLFTGNKLIDAGQAPCVLPKITGPR